MKNRPSLVRIIPLRSKTLSGIISINHLELYLALTFQLENWNNRRQNKQGLHSCQSNVDYFHHLRPYEAEAEAGRPRPRPPWPMPWPPFIGPPPPGGPPGAGAPPPGGAPPISLPTN